MSEEPDSDLAEVYSPMVGTFYRCPGARTRRPYVLRRAISVEKGQTSVHPRGHEAHERARGRGFGYDSRDLRRVTRSRSSSGRSCSESTPS